MNHSDDPTEDMAPPRSPDASDRLLSALAASDVPAATSGVGRLLAALRPPTESESVGEQTALAAITAAIRTAPTRLDDAPRSRMSPRRVSVRSAAVAAALVLVGGAAAAATGSLPDAAQSTVSKALSHVDIVVPNPDAPASVRGSHDSTGVDGDTGVGPDATGTAKRGLCTAWAARDAIDDHGRRADSTTFANLRRAAIADGLSVDDYCRAALASGDRVADGETPAGETPVDPSTLEPGGSGDAPGQPDAPPTPPATSNAGGNGAGGRENADVPANGSDHAAPQAEAGAGNASSPSINGTAGQP